jgi:TIR domain-containing protein
VTAVFINYRSKQDAWPVEVLQRGLVEVFGRRRVFVDHHSLPPGEHFEPILWDYMRRSAVVLVLIGQDWLTLADESGQRLLDREDDFVCAEIAHALDKDKVVVPVLVDGARLPKSYELPPGISELSKRQYRTLGWRSVARDVEIIVEAVREHVPEESLPSQQASGDQGAPPSITVNRGSVAVGEKGTSNYYEHAPDRPAPQDPSRSGDADG